MHAQNHGQWSEMHGSRVYGIRAVELVIPWSLLKELPLYHAALPCNAVALVTAWLVHGRVVFGLHVGHVGVFFGTFRHVLGCTMVPGTRGIDTMGKKGTMC